MSLLNTFRFLTRHPLTADHPWQALGRFIRWQLGSRLVTGPVAVNFVDHARLLVRPGMAGATGNIYAGLHEFEDMAFLLHLLRPDDLFVDVGANVGSYTVLAGGVMGARCLSIEPIPDTFQSLSDNIRLNGLEARVQAMNLGVGREPGVLNFSTALDCMNHVVDPSEHDVPTMPVEVRTLDSLLGDRQPTLIKIDVEGYEVEVLEGASKALENPGLLALIVEIADASKRYGHQMNDTLSMLERAGFRQYRYRPFDRQLDSLPGSPNPGGNSLWIRDETIVGERLSTASEHLVQGKRI